MRTKLHILISAVLAFALSQVSQGQNRDADEIYRKAQTNIAGGQWQQAAQQLETLARLRGNDPEVHFLLGMVYVQQGEFAPAARAFSQSLELDPASKETRFNLALACFRMGAYARVVGLYEGTGEQTLTADELRLVGGALVQLEQYPTAIRYLEEALKRGVDVQTYYDLGLALLKGKEDRRAQEVLADARSRFPTDSYVLLLSSVAAFITGSNPDAEAFMKQGLSLTQDLPSKILLLAAMGELYEGLGKFQAALETYQQATKLNPRDPDVLVKLGDSWARQGEGEKASASLRRALEVAPNSVTAHVSLGRLQLDRRLYRQARELLERAVKLDRYSIEGLYLLLRTYAAMGEHRLAKETEAEWHRLRKLRDQARGVTGP